MSFALLATGTAQHTRELPMAPSMFAFAALGLFAALLAVVWAFRNSAHKHQR
jgi:hypothetical protein